MLDLAAALATPIAKLFLKSWLGDTSADIGSNLFDIAKKRFDDRAKALEAQKKAKAVGAAVAEDLGRFFAQERAHPNDLEPRPTSWASRLSTTSAPPSFWVRR